MHTQTHTQIACSPPPERPATVNAMRARLITHMHTHTANVMYAFSHTHTALDKRLDRAGRTIIKRRTLGARARWPGMADGGGFQRVFNCTARKRITRSIHICSALSARINILHMLCAHIYVEHIYRFGFFFPRGLRFK